VYDGSTMTTARVDVGVVGPVWTQITSGLTEGAAGRPRRSRRAVAQFGDQLVQHHDHEPRLRVPRGKPPL